jgi:hypothetical protein
MMFMAGALCSQQAQSSSHMDAPLITFDDPANTTDVYAFVSQDPDTSTSYLTTAFAVYPFEEPGIGPNTYRFDDDARYNIHLALDGGVGKGRPAFTFQFDFKTEFRNPNTTLQSYLGVVDQVFDDNQNLRQTYTVTLIDNRNGKRTTLGSGRVPPNNQGLVTPQYNQGENGDNPAKEGVDSMAALDRYTTQSIAHLERGYRVFAGQRDDGFYADIQSIFDLDFTFGGPNKPFDSQGGYNVHTIVLDIPLEAIGKAKLAGVYATVERPRKTELRSGSSFKKRGDKTDGSYVQVARQGNPLFNEALVATGSKDLYNRTSPAEDRKLFAPFALKPELATVLGLPDQDRKDIAAIFIPDLIKIDLTTPPARPSGEDGFDRLSVFGGDTLTNAAGETVAGGFPNGRRFGDDVVDIALIALGVDPPGGALNADGVTDNEITFNRVFPYAATPLNGRNHQHHGAASGS